VLQSGAYSTASVVQNYSFDTAEMLRIVSELRQSINSLNPEKRAAAAQLVEGIEEESVSPTPRIARIKAFARELGIIAERGATEVISSGLLNFLVK
jgi:hypothetical protein